MRSRDRIRTDNRGLHGYVIRDSSNVRYVGWQDGNMIVWFKDGGVYRYDGVSVQRAVATALAVSVGKYIHRNIKRQYKVVKLA